jgi:hypothetical protein
VMGGVATGGPKSERVMEAGPSNRIRKVQVGGGPYTNGG